MISLITESFSNWSKDKATIWCAALAYYTVFSLGPLLLVIISVLGIFLSESTIQSGFIQQFTGLLGSQNTGLVTSLLSNTKHAGNGVIGSIIGFILLVFGASGIFGQLQDLLNHIWGVEDRPMTLKKTIISRLLNFSVLGVVAFLLLVSLIASTAIAAFNGYLNSLLPFSGIIAEGVNLLVSLILTTVLFASIFKIVPDIRNRWSDVWESSFITAILFTLGKTAIGIYIGRSGVSSPYGAAGSMVVLLLWVYYSSLIIFYGAEFNKSLVLQRERTKRNLLERHQEDLHFLSDFSVNFIKGFVQRFI